MKSAEVVAEYLGWDIADVKEHRYHYGHTTSPVYAFEARYICALRKDKRPPDSWDWNQVNCDFANRIGWQVWEALI